MYNYFFGVNHISISAKQNQKQSKLLTYGGEAHVAIKCECNAEHDWNHCPSPRRAVVALVIDHADEHHNDGNQRATNLFGKWKKRMKRLEIWVIKR